MNKNLRFTSLLDTGRFLIKWTLIAIPVSLVTGSLVAIFLRLLDWATVTRWQYGWLLFLLPVAGVAVHLLYKLWGKSSEAGNNLIMDEIHEPGGGVPAAMAPLVIATTIITHLFGGSAGREGTAVQVGGSMAGLFGKIFRLSKEDVRIILTAGIAGGFGAVFGTPIAGTIFALEVLAIGRLRYGALLPCFIMAVFSHLVCIGWGIHHTQYHIAPYTGQYYLPFLNMDMLLLGKVIVAGAVFGLCSRLFAAASHQLKTWINELIVIKRLIPVLGGVIIIAFTYALGTRDYLGLGVTSSDPNGVSIVSAFTVHGATTWSWLWKLIFTVITLSMGFKGGEVTPLFFIGATLGNTLSALMGVPTDLFAGLGFIAVFAGATNTPLACTLMGVELFGGAHVLYFAVACFTAYYFSGQSGIYTAQKRYLPK